MGEHDAARAAEAIGRQRTSMAEQVRYVAIGDSYTEGVGDELPDGMTRGWADLVAEGLAYSRHEPLEYANLAIRGRLIRPIIEEQLEAALALKPTMLSFNGGGNDLLRPFTSVEQVAELYGLVHRRCHEEGVHALIVSGGNPTRMLPRGRTMNKRFNALLAEVERVLRDAEGLTLVLPWKDPVLQDERFWSDDRLHLNTRGHHRAAATVLEALGAVPRTEWWDLPVDSPQRSTGLAYYRQHVAPWVGRRLTRRSSGDGCTPKFPEWIEVGPQRGIVGLS